jgi:hypothetical protein
VEFIYFGISDDNPRSPLSFSPLPAPGSRASLIRGIGVILNFIPICSETSRATAFDFYDGVLVFWIKRSFLVEVFCFIALNITAFS